MWCGDVVDPWRTNSTTSTTTTQEINVNGEVERRRGGRKKERKLEAENSLVESQQRQWASQAAINSSDGSEHDERGRWTNIKKGTPLRIFFYP